MKNLNTVLILLLLHNPMLAGGLYIQIRHIHSVPIDHGSVAHC